MQKEANNNLLLSANQSSCALQQPSSQFNWLCTVGPHGSIQHEIPCRASEIVFLLLSSGSEWHFPLGMVSVSQEWGAHHSGALILVLFPCSWSGLKGKNGNKPHTFYIKSDLLNLMFWDICLVECKNDWSPLDSLKSASTFQRR